MLIRRLPWTAICFAAALHFRFGATNGLPISIRKQLPSSLFSFFCSSSLCYLAIRVLNSADVILSEDTRHSGKLLHHYHIKTPLMSYHKFNESQREQVVLRRLKQGEIVALISDAGMPGISDPGMELAKLCVSENILVVPIPGPCALVSALSASGLTTDEFTFGNKLAKLNFGIYGILGSKMAVVMYDFVVGFLPKHSELRRKRLMVSADQTTTQIFYVAPHKLSQFLDESSSIFGDARC
ncbi:hypothetical protein JHK87_008764 [Glycine soja]|nr:hypothetical protein JHK87_008764 [Glycine soja]